MQHHQRFGGPFLPEQQISQGLAQADVTRVLAVQRPQLLDHLGPLADDVAANAQVFKRCVEIRRVIAEQLLENRGGFVRSACGGKQAGLLQGLLALRVLQFHQALGLAQCCRIGSDGL